MNDGPLCAAWSGLHDVDVVRSRNRGGCAAFDGLSGIRLGIHGDGDAADGHCRVDLDDDLPSGNLRDVRKVQLKGSSNRRIVGDENEGIIGPKDDGWNRQRGVDVGLADSARKSAIDVDLLVLVRHDLRPLEAYDTTDS